MDPLALAIGLTPVVVGFFVWAARSAVRQIVQPLADDLRAHMAKEAEESAAINVKLEAIHGSFRMNDLEHAVFAEKIRRLEDK